ncbi:hypothetical protein GLOIN_2v1835573 [Rhizophagus irregularis DAOM 181602=DAOM 197198]|nr:hypothetical protein GLOIN_2v1835573 [Rhizophagus irregularis DAOM 181602=DAOM 197198]
MQIKSVTTLLCDLLHSIKDHVKNEKHLKKFEIERNALPKVGMPMLNMRFFGQMDTIIKDFLTPVMLGKHQLRVGMPSLSSCWYLFPIFNISYKYNSKLMVDSHSYQPSVKSSKAIYAELFGLSKTNMQHKLVNLLKAFIYDTQNKNIQEVEPFDVNNPAIIKHKR